MSDSSISLVCSRLSNARARNGRVGLERECDRSGFILFTLQCCKLFSAALNQEFHVLCMIKNWLICSDCRSPRIVLNWLCSFSLRTRTDFGLFHAYGTSCTLQIFLALMPSNFKSEAMTKTTATAKISKSKRVASIL